MAHRRIVEHVRHFQAGHVLFEQGQRAAEAYLLLSGGVEFWRDGRTVTKAVPGDLVGELAIISDMPRLMTAKAVTDLKCLAISRADFHTIVASLPPNIQGMVHSVTNYVQDVFELDFDGNDPTLDNEEAIVQDFLGHHGHADAMANQEAFAAHLCKCLLRYANTCIRARNADRSGAPVD